MSNEIIVYWASPAIPKNLFSSPLDFGFKEPTSVLDVLRKDKNKTPQPQSVFSCPAHKSMLKNVYSIDATENYTFNLARAHSNPSTMPVVNSPYDFASPRQSGLDGYTDIEPAYSWLFFASEPLIARFTAPYLPAVSPAEGSFLVCGEFDIGQWYRPFVLNYMVPKHVPYLTILKNSPLCFVEFKTDKNIVFKKYEVNDILNLYSNKCLRSPVEVGRSYTLESRYEWLNEAITAKTIIYEIEKNLLQ